MSENQAYLVDPELLAEFVEEYNDALSQLPAHFVNLERSPSDEEVINAIFRPIHSMKGNAAYFGLLKIKTLAHEMETVLDKMRNHVIVAAKNTITVLLEGVDALIAMLGRVQRNEDEVVSTEAMESLLARIRTAGDAAQKSDSVLVHEALDALNEARSLLPSDHSELTRQCDAIASILKRLCQTPEESSARASGGAAADEPRAAEPQQRSDTTGKDERDENPSADKGKTATRRTMRVAEDNVDKFLEYVGELIVVREMFDYLQKQLATSYAGSAILEEFKRTNASFDQLSHDLQESIMAIRKIPVRSILNKIPRIVRDIAVATDKDINVRVVGEDVEIDKSLIELLEAPLVHMVRNAADHGIETPDVRTGCGKSSTGTVTVSVEEQSDDIAVTIADDGAGLNMEAIRKKSEELGLLQPGQSLTQQEVVSFIFSAGVSTAEKVTDVSGRGVGMDVVKQSIEKLGGKVSVETQSGKGTTFTLRIPKAVGTQIMNGFLVRVDAESFILPVESIVESFYPKTDDFNTLANQGMTVRRRDLIMPYLRLADVFGLSRNNRNGETDNTMTVVSIKQKEKVFGIGVDEILGLQQIVVKHVNGLEQHGNFFAGAAVTGSGKVAMIVDVEKVLGGS